MPLSAKRLAVSAFLVFHLTAVGVWNLPDCALKAPMVDFLSVYMLPTGLWQEWGMFAPEPSKDTMCLEAIVRDSRGIIRLYAFPRMMDRTAVEGLLGGFRHSKFACNVGATGGKVNREVAARHVARGMNIPRDAYPLDVQLIYEVWPTNPPTAPVDEPPAAPWQSVIETYRFNTPEDAAP